MKYAVIGLGAVGGIVSSLLRKSGKNVTLIGKKNQVDVIKKNGLKIKGLNSPIILKDLQVSDNLSAAKDVNVVFICIKSQDTEDLAYCLKNVINANTLIVSLQNGVRNSMGLGNITGCKILSGIVLFNSICEKPGEVTLTVEGGILLEKDEKYSKIVSNVLNNSGLKTIVVENVEGLLWSKLLLNLQIAVTALTGQTIRESIVNRDSRRMIIATINEGADVVEKSGIKLERLPEVDPIRIVKRLNKYNSFILGIGSRLIGVKENARNSMWQSLSRGKPTEIDYINGEIVNLARMNNLEAPINKKLVKLVKEVERKHLSKSFKPGELKKLLGIQ